MFTPYAGSISKTKSGDLLNENMGFNSVLPIIVA